MFIRKDGCKGNPKNSSIRNVCGHTPSGYSISTILPLKSKKKLCMQTFCESLNP